ncbi:hypothetical protein AAFF_G00227560 [Aldrovandia affinis]|uniref:Uncharacterized protein n=1 Tax=Aldrovandia affinis TaxID=143900 RepID=A0AAD7X2M0_9TELE|nr:hypothetical protein AAFF_G00227560 [Aldrovandia affinis]
MTQRATMTWRFTCVEVLMFTCIYLPRTTTTQPSTTNIFSTTGPRTTTTQPSTTNIFSTTGSPVATMVMTIHTEDYNGINVYVNADSTAISINGSEVENYTIYVSIPPDLFSMTYAPKTAKFIFSLHRETLPDMNGDRLLGDIRFGIKVENVTIRNLSTPFLMILYHKSPLKEGYRPKCVFLNQSGQWDTEGCRTEGAHDTTTCSCDHFSFFGALLIRDVAISEAHSRALQLLTYIGCSISAFFCTVTLTNHCLRRTGKTDQALLIHLWLVGALLLLNLLFMCNVGVAPLKMSGLCTTLALLLHYSLLCCFTWMALEAVHLYRLLIKVYNTYVRHYLWKIGLLGWGAPAVAVCIIVAVSPEFYGLIETGAGEMCWIRSDAVFYTTIVAYFALVLLFNTTVLIYIMVRMFHLRTQKLSQEKGQHTRTVCSVLGLTCALGLTWGLGFLSSGYTNLPILYTFTVLNSLQGFFICTWICVMRCHRREAVSCTTEASFGMQGSMPSDTDCRTNSRHTDCHDD